MKKLILILFVLTTLALKSQSYIPLPNDTATWGIKQTNISMSSTTTSYFTEIQKGDSLINGIKFHKIYKNTVSNSSLIGLFREVGKKAYCKIIPYPDTNQVLLYDFNLNIGDTFYDKYKYLGNDITWKYKVQNISTTTLTTNTRKQYDLSLVGGPSFPSPCSNQTWIEGIGSTTTFFNTREGIGGPCYTQSLGNFVSYQLSCFEHHFIQYMANSCITLDLNNHSLIKESVSVLPNPNNGFFKIILPSSNIRIKYIIVSDILGNEVFRQQGFPIDQLEIKIYPVREGLYFLTLVADNGKTTSQKIIIN